MCERVEVAGIGIALEDATAARRIRRFADPILFTLFLAFLAFGKGFHEGEVLIRQTESRGNKVKDLSVGANKALEIAVQVVLLGDVARLWAVVQALVWQALVPI